MMLLTLMYVGAIIASFLPWTLVMKAYVKKVDLETTVSELKDVIERLSKTPPRKEKKLRILKSRYKELRGRLNRVFLMNMFTLWIGIFTSLMFARSILYYAVTHLHMSLPPSPLNLPGISLGGRLNDLVLYLATVVGYQYFHNNYSGISILSRIRTSEAQQPQES